ncbi:acetyl esterase/lipase [Nocardiopsis mwathae]|uniref:Acetyl esterase/lipase n=1 Tax=Nocardiopsis mwathae TaxID=1472723 RepID=A0A7W9YLY4_9ACTN|nr:alpha/beta hydrolase [Nocardiopsis mwathae]MBB6174502.1 acetyl esterase/lipase [Nocardiopsis mwathae]
MAPPPPPFDPELAPALELLRDQSPERLTPEVIAAQRAAAAAHRPSPENLSCGGTFEVEERTAPGRNGSPDVDLLVLRPAHPGGPRPVLYYMHGGGMVMGDATSGIERPQEWARELGLTVVSVDYRLAPEHPYPDPVEDCYAGLLWTAEHAAEIGGDADRLIVAGTSAGAGLAAATVLLSRDRNGPTPIGQLLVCPMLDDRNDTPSAHQMAGHDLWDQSANEVGWSALLGDLRGSDDVPPYAAPARATDLSGLPPTFIDVGSAETFRDEAVSYASGIWNAGGRAELHVWPGGFHSFDGLAPHAALSQAARTARLNWLRRLLGE